MSELLAALAIGIPLSIYRAYALTLLWAWFIVPGFGLHPISKTLAYGVLLVVGMFDCKVPDDKPGEFWQRLFVYVFFSLLQTSLAIASGWIARGWLQ